MGVNIRSLLVRKEIKIDDLKNKVIAFDAYNILYQFLSTIRARDGTPLMDSRGRVTSHLIGLFNRITNFMSKGIKPVFVFDGKRPELKSAEIEKRRAAKREAEAKYKAAVKAEDVEAMRKYASRFSYLSPEMVEQAKQLLDALGVPVIQAPSEGEAQAAQLVKTGKAWAVASQDYDSLLFGTERLIQNLSIVGRRKKAKALGTYTVKPELISLSENLNALKLDNDKLIALAMMIGTDFNPGGIKGIGPKKALALVQKHKDFDEMFKEAKWDEHCELPWKTIYDVFKKMPVIKDYKLIWKTVDEQAINDLLIKEHDFSPERVQRGIDPLIKVKKAKQQTSLGEF